MRRGPDSRHPSEASSLLQAMGPTCPHTDRLPCTSQTSQSEGAHEEGARRLDRRVGGSSIKNRQTAGPQTCLNVCLFKEDFYGSPTPKILASWNQAHSIGGGLRGRQPRLSAPPSPLTHNAGIELPYTTPQLELWLRGPGQNRNWWGLFVCPCF